jgi:hypothetical protein
MCAHRLTILLPPPLLAYIMCQAVRCPALRVQDNLILRLWDGQHTLLLLLLLAVACLHCSWAGCCPAGCMAASSSRSSWQGWHVQHPIWLQL